MAKKITKKVAYGRISMEGGNYSYHATKGWRRKSSSQESLTNGHNKLMEFLSKGK